MVLEQDLDPFVGGNWMNSAYKGFTFLSATWLAPNIYLLISGCLQYFYEVRKRSHYFHFRRFWTIWLKSLVIMVLLFTHIYDCYKTNESVWNVLSIITYFLALFLHVVEQPTLRIPMASLLMFWLFKFLASALVLLLRPNYTMFPMLNVVPSITFFCSLVCLLAEIYVPPANRVWYPDDAAELEETGLRPSRFTYANIFSRISFGWLSPLMKFGYRNYLTESDAWSLPPAERSSNLTIVFEKNWISHAKKKKSSLYMWGVLFLNHWKLTVVIIVLKLVQDVVAFIQPNLIRKIVIFVSSYSSEHPQPPQVGFSLAIAMFLTNVVQTALLQQYFQLGMVLGMRWRSELITAIYRKSLRLSSAARQSRSVGDIVNYMSVDTQKVCDLTMFLFVIVSGPFQIVLALTNLYHLVGYGALSGAFVTFLLFPCNVVIASIFKRFQNRQMKNKDARSQFMTEIINNIRSIKLYAWENIFLQKLLQLRNTRELRMLKKIGIVNTIGNFTWLFAPILVSAATFGTFIVLYGKTRVLSVDIVFACLSLFNLLQFPLTMLPIVVSSVLEASVAISRIYGFLTAGELDSNAVQRYPANKEPSGVCLEIKKGTFSWSGPGQNAAEPTLRDIDFVARRGELCCIVGKVGMGKSSLLEACLGNMQKHSGSVFRCGSIAYAAQQPWILNATIQENILFGLELDPEFYEKTIRACCLLRDFEILADGDQTEVGEKGISLSGGQKARISLARAVYSRSDIYLLDDILSAVDQHVNRDLVRNLLGSKGLLRSRCVILSTNSLTVLKEASMIYMLRNGKIIESGSFTQLSSSPDSQLFQLLSEFSKKDTASSTGADTPLSRSQSVITSSTDVTSSASRSSDTVSNYPKATIKGTGRIRKRLTDEDNVKATGQAAEKMERGKVKWKVYWTYFKACSLFLIFLYFLFIIGGIGMNVGTNVWLKHWSEVNTQLGYNPKPYFYLGIYTLFGLLSCALISLSSLTITVFCAIKSCRYLHDSMVKAVLRAPMSFFETTPTGRILNRFSSDVYRVDEVISRVFMFFFRNLFQIVFVLAVICYSSPMFMILIVPLFFLYRYNQVYYTQTSRELKRLDSVTRSPLYAHFQESLGGLSTIRAYDMEDTFISENDIRVDTNHRIWFLYFSSNRWQAIRVEAIGALVVFSSAFFGVLSAVRGNPNSGLVGLSLSYAVQITQSLTFVVRQSVDVETNIVSVERMLEYIGLPSEAPSIIPDHRPPEGWPSHGAIKFDHYSVRYRENLPLVLNDISVNIKPQEKIGIVGRTGAGKSTLTLALFRLIEPTSGDIQLDDINITSIGLHDLRSRLAIIPQENQAFEGTIRENLDPNANATDEEIWHALEAASLKQFIQTLDGGLYSRVTEGGANLSSGQRQLMCLTRALLTPTRVLLLDEATAAVDVETDAIVQRTIRERFNDRTILTIAHRINTVMDSNRILVLDHGKVVEFDSTKKLLENKASLFYSLAKESGLI
ncbi:ATP-binding cassette transporter abc2 [Schizosaccharomyces pombe]|uniref:ATP-binding cassette transporter abc2 n=1 Tax=Schizosaccharomyces pombe (strain 972 / ATCC 24843) TaxID=284812 RepID=ABC2_SCHPO|nr:glutathione S-conjugate-exporting ATPase Abc2 [Schizosaccharomyces pombe]Q10185.1 RecName: Full=ATP-binding cassette transporter abc2; Short=ABC transporter abc2; AltName: Full=ATP-energized glutathione S-conjugate pump abc2; AltName: Full=Glutathione S-conjugate-transporting ATPase abc2 [Schizosaccharomyces pombe 972h-]CAA93309.3 glutathione S-conjugate-exporting ATPase Abc2 [Schizosaccharomyces pombe]|eukprot:NP_593943.3 glutathione S-conjugate-exporting ATPase Abc2 [Schizosaccharomyces pombe]